MQSGHRFQTMWPRPVRPISTPRGVREVPVQLPLALTLIGAAATPVEAGSPRPQDPCDIYGSAGTACVAAHSTTGAVCAPTTARSTRCTSVGLAGLWTSE